jgi:RimJ/RimL family protein N-acetyltransferase
MFRKPQSVRGRQLLFRDAAVDDAAFILALRTDAKKGEFLSSTAPDLLRQRDWLARYASDNGQVYFIICRLDGEPVGTVRLYDQRGDSFCWGSWIKSDGAPSGFGVESALMVYDFALQLDFTRAHFDVRKQNVSVCQFHERFGARKVDENADDNFYEMSNDAIKGALLQYRKYLPDGAAVAF